MEEQGCCLEGPWAPCNAGPGAQTPRRGRGPIPLAGGPGGVSSVHELLQQCASTRLCPCAGEAACTDPGSQPWAVAS